MRDGDVFPVAVDTQESCQQNRPVQLITESGLISGSALLDSGRCIWQISVGRGQRVRLRPDVFRPGSKSAIADGDAEGTACPWMLTVEGGEKAVRVPLCSRTNPRLKPLDCEPHTPDETCSLFLDWPDGFADDKFPVFVVHYEGIKTIDIFGRSSLHNTE